MALQTVAVTNRSPGVDLTDDLVAADTGLTDKWPNTGKELLLIANGSGATYTATFPIQVPVDGQTVAPLTATVAAGKTRIFGPFPTQWYNNAQNQAEVEHSSATNITLLVVQPTQN